MSDLKGKTLDEFMKFAVLGHQVTKLVKESGLTDLNAPKKTRGRRPKQALGKNRNDRSETEAEKNEPWPNQATGQKG